jgi:hypothetical protein
MSRLSFALHNRGAGEATFEQGGFAVEAQFAAGFLFAVAFQARLDQNGPNLRLEECDLVRVISTDLDGGNSERQQQKRDAMLQHGGNSKDAENHLDKLAGSQAGDCAPAPAIIGKSASAASTLTKLPGCSTNCK